MDIETFKALSEKLSPLMETQKQLRAIRDELPAIVAAPNDYIDFICNKLRDAEINLKHALNTMFTLSGEVDKNDLNDFMKRKIDEMKFVLQDQDDE